FPFRLHCLNRRSMILLNERLTAFCSIIAQTTSTTAREITIIYLCPPLCLPGMPHEENNHRYSGFYQ
ncbi:hypothetical protein V7P28_01535, partial [Klebsiella michiganensis]